MLFTCVLAFSFQPNPARGPVTYGSSRSRVRLSEGDPWSSVQRLGAAALDRVMEEASKGAMQGEGLPKTAPGSVGDTSVLPLPDSFDQSVAFAASAVGEAVADGHTRLLIEFDTSAGDETYTSLARTMQLVRPLLPRLVSEVLGPPHAPPPSPPPAVDTASDTVVTDTATELTEEVQPRLQLLFPDEGTAAYVQQKWLEVDAATAVGSMPRANLAEGVELLLLVAPQATDSAAVQKLLAQIEERAPATLALLVNPTLVNLQSTGYGLVGRELRTMVQETFAVCYALASYPTGALFRSYPGAWTLWRGDDAADGSGYVLEWSGGAPPSGDEVAERLSAADEQDSGFLGGLGAFIKGFQAM